MFSPANEMMEDDSASVTPYDADRPEAQVSIERTAGARSARNPHVPEDETLVTGSSTTIVNLATEDHHVAPDSSLYPEDPYYHENSNTDVPSWEAVLGLTQEETNQFLDGLRETVPDVGRLFDGSIGSFGWN